MLLAKKEVTYQLPQINVQFKIQWKWLKGLDTVLEQCLSSVENICTNVKERFSDIRKSASFKNIQSILSTFIWPVNRGRSVFSNDVIKKIYRGILKHFKGLLVKNGCDITKVPCEWLMLKTQVIKNPNY